MKSHEKTALKAMKLLGNKVTFLDDFPYRSARWRVISGDCGGVLVIITRPSHGPSELGAPTVVQP